MEKTIAVLGGDRRMALLARLLAEDGHPVQTWGLAAFGMEDTALEEAAQADRVVLPVPLSRGKNLNCTAAALPLCGLFALLRPEQRLYAGGVKAADREAAAEFGLTLTDYRYCGIVTFVSDRWEGEYMHLFHGRDALRHAVSGHRLRAHRQAARPPSAGAGRGGHGQRTAAG